MTNPKLEESIQLYLTGKSIATVCEITGMTVDILRRNLKKRNLTRSNKENSRKYQVNHAYFSTIDSEDKAYWLGFLYADGYVSKKLNPRIYKRIGCSLAEKDLDHLEKLKQSLQATYPIGHYIGTGYNAATCYARLIITSDQLFDDLVKLGCIEHKTLVLKFPTEKQVPLHLTNHFIRGYFDGDGSFAKCGKNRKGYDVKICGTKELLNALSKHIGFPNRNLSKRHKDTKNTYCLEIGGGKQVAVVGEYLYKDATLWLERKHQRFLEHLRRND